MKIAVNFELRSCSFILSPHKFYECGARAQLYACTHSVYAHDRYALLYYFGAHHIFSKHQHGLHSVLRNVLKEALWHTIQSDSTR